MGNQLTGAAPLQILPVEHYLTDLPEYDFVCSLGSTRFFKVAQAKHKEGNVVVKVFVVHDPSLPYTLHGKKIEEVNMRLLNATNCLPFQKTVLSETSKAAFIFRQFIKDSLYDRISTRPFLIAIEKKWIAFQLLCALNQCHKLQVCHGDIKSENVLVTSWNWVLLTDFASFKPTYLPDDNPADFSYFFDTSRRRTCYIAPERFIESTGMSEAAQRARASWRHSGNFTNRNSKNSESQVQQNIDLTTSVIKKGDLNSAMDIFSAGCVITELFTEGTRPFDLSQLLEYRKGDKDCYSPWQILERIDDRHIRELVRNMIERDPRHRLTAEEYLIQQRGKAFPEYFYTFAKLYLQRFASVPIMSSDDRVMRIKKDLQQIFIQLGVDEDHPEKNMGLVLFISVITSSLRSLHYCSSKLTALEIMLSLSKYVTSDVILDRLVPYMLLLVNDQFARVRAETVRVLTHSLDHVRSVPRRFLELVQLNGSSEDKGTSAGQEDAQYEGSYDAELQALHETIQQKVQMLLSDPANIVKQTLIENGITKLCVFFGRQKANDTLLSHMITFLNDKYDWQLRGAFFDCIVGVAAYVGWQSSSILKPLLEQGLSDIEEFVIHKALAAVTSLVELGLIQKPILHELLKEIVPFLAHPNDWIRFGAAGVIAAVARSLNIADVHCHLLPLVQPFLQQTIIQVDKEVVLMNALQDPLPRAIYDYVIKSPLIDKFFEVLKNRKISRDITRHGSPNYDEMDENLNQMFRKLFSQGLGDKEEDKLLSMKDFMLKINRMRSGYSESGSSFEEETFKSGVLDISSLGNLVTRRHADMIKPEQKAELQLNASRKKSKKPTTGESMTSTMNEEWKHMFGAAEEDTNPQLPKPGKQKQELGLPEPTLTHMTTDPKMSPLCQSMDQSPNQSTLGLSQGGTVVEGVPQKPVMVTKNEKLQLQSKISPCKLELRNLVYEKREQYLHDCITRELSDNATHDPRPPPSTWRPKGLLVAHLHEHRAAVNRIRVSEDHQLFATCSNDGCVKLWDGSRMEGKSVTNRSRQTYNKQGGQIKCLSFCESSQSLAAGSDNGTIHVLRIDPAHKMSAVLSESVDTEEHGTLVDMNYFDTGSQSVLAYATVSGHIIGWDLRSPRKAWTLKNDPRHGLITSFSVHHQLAWLALGTSNGTHLCWDMRFQLPITTVLHPTGARVRRVTPYPLHPSWLVSAVQGNNEVSFWDLETGARQKTLWASSAPPLSTTQTSSHSVNGLYLGVTEGSNFLLTAGSDMRVRYWDLQTPTNSHIVCGAASDPINQQTTVSYESKLIEGTEVLQENYAKVKGAGVDDVPRRSPDAPPQGHHDIITDINTFQTTQCFIVTCSRDGVVKVWK
ncbi:phosphoinositide 3-kinase regulatory subunit 4 [Lingula anatina]|uniref:non-specific serine/threonine protein kinase n=1 Tax=Lingula anatina TaxID=7574 RepID=A0A1S3IHZ3_LINAN|nr:phosphoinositide 3-kinase regulatory subunit 4 [Lingula anatina]|eukprot:XP_013397860.1 phosphoinositide 3-kinase regulatory subunit 4 [Lingula anatina]